MAETIDTIPEIRGLSGPNQIIRIPPELDIPVTPRVIRIIDSKAFRRLSGISQLGLVRLVYPGAGHSRFEHSLGVYRNALLFLQRLTGIDQFDRACSVHEAELLIVASLLHDLGHWPYCHAIEDMRMTGVPSHEQNAKIYLADTELSRLLRNDWGVEADEICELLAPKEKSNPRYSLLGSILSGPIDIDKLDYLDRDSLYAGVPYGRNFDRHRLISQLCLGPTGRSLAITEKARTAAEMMVFARYVMFSEVYWHHAVRSATSMLQRAVWELKSDWLSQSSTLVDSDFIQALKVASHGTQVESIVDGLFGEKRNLFKRLCEYHRLDQPTIHERLSRRPYVELVELSRRLSSELSKSSGHPISPTDVLVDAPPQKLEVQFNIQVRLSNGTFLPLGTMSPVAQTLANDQFDNLVKRVRVFVCSKHREALRKVDFAAALLSCLD
jgi:HD superfamily phosphohydrolase